MAVRLLNWRLEMNIALPGSRALALILMAALPMAVPAAAQAQAQAGGETDDNIMVYGETPVDLSGFPDGPEIEGYISARNGGRLLITSLGGEQTAVALSESTEVRAKGGFLGLSKTKLATEALLNGLPVTVETVQWGSSLIAKRIKLSDDDLETAAMIQTGTDQRFTRNEAATEALRGRMADIDKYNIKGTTNVYFDTGKWNLSPSGQRELCTAAQQAEAMDNALLLVVGYTDSVGDQDYNQVLSERRAGRVVNFLQQECGWKPWRMLTPTGMAEADPLADNSTAEGKAQNRRVAVNILVSKSVDGF